MSLGICEARNHLAPVPHGRRMLSSNRENPTWVGSQQSGKISGHPLVAFAFHALKLSTSVSGTGIVRSRKPSASIGIPACVTLAPWQLPDSHLSNSNTLLPARASQSSGRTKSQTHRRPREQRIQFGLLVDLGFLLGVLRPIFLLDDFFSICDRRKPICFKICCGRT